MRPAWPESIPAFHSWPEPSPPSGGPALLLPWRLGGGRRGGHCSWYCQWRPATRDQTELSIMLMLLPWSREMCRQDREPPAGRRSSGAAASPPPQSAQPSSLRSHASQLGGERYERSGQVRSGQTYLPVRPRGNLQKLTSPSQMREHTGTLTGLCTQNISRQGKTSFFQVPQYAALGRNNFVLFCFSSIISNYLQIWYLNHSSWYYTEIHNLSLAFQDWEPS